MNTERDNWVDFLRLPLMVGVIAIHAYDPTRSIDGVIVSMQGWSALGDYLMFTLSQVFARLSVPLFFVFAGYFLFAKISPGNYRGFWSSLRKRWRSLCIPYVVWNLFFVLFLWFFFWFGFYLPAEDSRYIWLLSDDISYWVSNVFGFFGSPVQYQFWFLRDLIILCVLSVFLVPARTGVILCLVFFLGGAWLTGFFSTSVPSIQAVTFFLVGVYCARSGSLFMVWVPRWLFVLYLIAALAEYFFRNLAFYEFLHRICLVLGVMSAFWISGLLSMSEKVRLASIKFGSGSFFLYAFHEPLLTALKKLITLWVSGPISALVAYFVLILIPILVSLSIYELLRRRIPRAVSVLVGGR